jgi:DNA-binding transcriptional regulator YhcF (GntR family)
MASNKVEYAKRFPFHYCGLDATETGDGQFLADCPFCGKEKHFYIDGETGKYSCKVCDVTGNTYTFIRSFYETLLTVQNTSTIKKEWIKLVGDRSLSEDNLKAQGIVFYEEKREWIIPVYNLQKKVVNLRRYYMAEKGRKTKRFALPGMSLSLGGLETLKSDTETIWLCEGEWDAFALKEILEEDNPDFSDGIFWLPGSGTFQESWIDVFKDKTTILCYDFDKAGRIGRAKAANILFKHGIPENKILMVDWEQTGTNKDGYDLRDFYATNAPLSQLQSIVIECPKDNFADREEKTSEILAKFPHISERDMEWREVVDTLGQNFALSRDLKLGFKLLASNVISLNVRDSTPNWSHLVAPAGSAKTELISAFGTCKHVYILSNASSKALVSGFPGKGGSDPSLVPKIIGKTLMIKDFTEVLQMARGDQEEMMGVLRGAYDGYIVKCFGNGIVRQYPDCHFNLITGVTSVIYGDNKAAMGERFLKYPMINGNSFENIDNVLLTAIDQTGREKAIREELQAKVKTFCEVRFTKDEIPDLLPEDKEMLVGLARVLSFLRAEVTYIPGTEVLAYKPQIEYGTRPMKVMSIVLRSLGMVNGKSFDYLPTDEDREIVVRIAVGSSTPYSFDIAKKLYETGDEGLTRRGLAEELGMKSRYATVNHYLNILENLQFVTSYEGEKDDPSKPGEAPRFFRLSDEAFEIWERSRIQDFISNSPLASNEVPNRKTGSRVDSETRQRKIDKFWERVERSSEIACWPHSGRVNESGYVRIKFMGAMQYVHRIAISLHLDRPLETGEVVLHKCNNRRCCNPYHLSVGTIVENNRQIIADGRVGKRTGKRRLTKDEVLKIKQGLAMGQGTWQLAKAFDMSKQGIRDIKNKKTWKGLSYSIKITQETDLFEDE